MVFINRCHIQRTLVIHLLGICLPDDYVPILLPKRALLFTSHPILAIFFSALRNISSVLY